MESTTPPERRRAGTSQVLLVLTHVCRNKSRTSDFKSQDAEVHVSVDGTDRKANIELKDISEGHRTLGAWKCLNGSQEKQIEISRAKFETFGTNIAASTVDKVEGLMAAE